MKRFIIGSFILSLLFGLGCLSRSVFAQHYTPAQQAYREGMKALKEKDEASATVYMESAFQLAGEDTAFRVKVSEVLISLHRKGTKVEPFQTSAEYILNHADQSSKRSGAVRSLTAFLFQRGKLDAAVAEYEKRLEADPDNYVALAILSRVYARRRADRERGQKLAQRLAVLETAKAKQFALQCEKEARLNAALAAWNWKEAAMAWMQAGDKAQALAAAKQSLSAAPEARNDLLAYFWRDHLGDVLLFCEEKQQAITQFEAALAVAKIEAHKKATEAKLVASRKAD